MNNDENHTSEDAARRAGKKDIAGVIAPPPLIFLACTLLGVALHFLAPIAVMPAPLNGWLGPTFIGLGVILVALCFRSFRKAKTEPRPDRPTTAIVCAGPYRFSRNPMYVAASLVQIGIGIWVNSIWIIAMLIPALIVVSYGVISREERYLERKFGEGYLGYKTSVRRWL